MSTQTTLIWVTVTSSTDSASRLTRHDRAFSALVIGPLDWRFVVAGVLLEPRRSLPQLPGGAPGVPLLRLQEIFRNVHALAGSGYSHRNDGAEAGPSTSSPTKG
jgi:hypothetical protein